MPWICYLLRVSGAQRWCDLCDHMRTCVLADGPKPKKTHTKLDKNIGCHLKKKTIGTPKVFQRLYVFHLYAQRNHSLSAPTQTTNHKPQTTNHKPQTTNHKPQTTNHKPQTTTRPTTQHHNHHDGEVRKNGIPYALGLTRSIAYRRNCLVNRNPYIMLRWLFT